MRCWTGRAGDRGNFPKITSDKMWIKEISQRVYSNPLYFLPLCQLVFFLMHIVYDQFLIAIYETSGVEKLVKFTGLPLGESLFAQITIFLRHWHLLTLCDLHDGTCEQRRCGQWRSGQRGKKSREEDPRTKIRLGNNSN